MPNLDKLSDFTQKAPFLLLNMLIPLALIAVGIISGVFLLRIAFRKRDGRDFHWKLHFLLFRKFWMIRMRSVLGFVFKCAFAHSKDQRPRADYSPKFLAPHMFDEIITWKIWEKQIFIVTNSPVLADFLPLSAAGQNAFLHLIKTY